MIVLGMSGIFFTIALYGSFFYRGFVAQEGQFVEVYKKAVQRNLMATMKEVEVYKVQTGQYPDTIAYLLTKHEAKMQEMFEDRDKEPTYADMMELNITMNSQSEMEMKRSMYAQDPFYLNSLSFVLFSSSHEFSARLLQYKKVDENHYQLWSRGPDRESGTEDDIYLTVDSEQKVGCVGPEYRPGSLENNAVDGDGEKSEKKIKATESLSETESPKADDR